MTKRIEIEFGWCEGHPLKQWPAFFLVRESRGSLHDPDDHIRGVGFRAGRFFRAWFALSW